MEIGDFKQAIEYSDSQRRNLVTQTLAELYLRNKNFPDISKHYQQDFVLHLISHSDLLDLAVLLEDAAGSTNLSLLEPLIASCIKEYKSHSNHSHVYAELLRSTELDDRLEVLRREIKGTPIVLHHDTSRSIISKTSFTDLVSTSKRSIDSNLPHSSLKKMLLLMHNWISK